MPSIAIVMGSTSDWNVMQNAAKILQDFGIDYEAKVVSAHRTPDLLFEFATTAKDKGIKVIIAGAGGTASSGNNYFNSLVLSSSRKFK